jgi:predicted molibdopterin-dependent oxidoreductase YjgC
VFGGVAGAMLNGRAGLPARTPYEAPPAGAETKTVEARPTGEHFLGELRLHRYRPLFSGPFVERVDELAFQRPPAEIELSADDAARRAVASGDTVVVRSNGTSVELRARVNRRLIDGVARVADEHADDLHQHVEVVKQ